MTSSRPYLVRAFYDWIVDNGLTPQLIVNATLEGVVVPQDYVPGRADSLERGHQGNPQSRPR